MSTFELSVRFFLQLAFILAMCRVVGWLAGRVGQPQVVGEMIAGVLLGPSLFGLLWPEAQGWMFPKESKPILFAVAQLGLSIYMFLVGVEFDHELIRKRLRGAAAVSAAGIVVPFCLGAIAAVALFGTGILFPPQTQWIEGALFLGAAMSITAFPMLARIIYERGLSGTSLGTLTLAAGAVDDAAAWCVLAVVLASFANNAQFALLAIGGGLAYAAFCLLALRPLIARLGRTVDRAGGMSPAMLGSVLCMVMLGSWFTDAIGIYAVFGAFLLGVAMPRGLFADELRRKLEPMTTALLLPLFFVYSGLNTRMGLLSDASLIGVTLLLLVLAIAGKGLACYVAARFHGESHRESMAIGSLMNARGLMELIILNIGLEHKLITPALFTMMVLMAITTTLMASPLFEACYGRWSRSPDRTNPV